MAYTWTNTNTNIPLGYIVKVVFTSDGTGSNANTTNGGYILSMGDIETGVDGLLGEVKYPTVSFTVRNVANFFSGTLFAGSFTQIRTEIWISYDVGSTWENLFFGEIDLKSITEAHVSASESRSRVFNFTARHMMLTLKDSTATTPSLDSMLDPSGFNVKTLGATALADRSTIYMYNTTTYNRYTSFFPPYTQVSHVLTFSDLFAYAYSTVPMNYQGWPLSWGCAQDYSYCGHRFKCAYRDGGPTIAETAIGGTSGYYPALPVSSGDGVYISFVKGGQSSRPAPYWDPQQFPTTASTAYEFARALNESLYTFVDPRMDWNSGAPTVTMFHKPRAASTGSAITGTLPVPLSVSMDHANWLTGIKVQTRGMAETSELGGTNAKGNQLIHETKLNTIPLYASYERWTNIQHIEESGGAKYDSSPMMNQVLLYNPTTDVCADVHQFKVLGSQSLFPDLGTYPTGSFYGFQQAIFDVMQSTFPIGLANPTTSEQWKLAFKTLRGSNVADIALMKTIPFAPYGGASRSILITGLRRSVMRGTTEITGYKVA